MERGDVYFAIRTSPWALQSPVCTRFLGHGKGRFRSWGKILSIHHRMVQFALQTGCPHPRWTQCISCILEKDTSSPKLSRLRFNNLYEADLNQVLKILWSSHLVPHAEYHGLLGEDQHGSFPFRSSLDVVLRKSLTYIITTQQK